MSASKVTGKKKAGLCPRCNERIASDGRTYCRECATERTKRYYALARIEVIASYGGVCVCCGEDALDFLALDHIKGGGVAHRAKVGGGYGLYMWARKNSYPDLLQVLCANCNIAKVSGKGICRPHEKVLDGRNQAFSRLRFFAPIKRFGGFVKIGSLCSGAGMLDLAVLDVFPDATISWFAENDPAASKVLRTRFPGIRNHGDIMKLRPWMLDPVDMLTAGFPCTDLSRAGEREGLQEGNRSGLWYTIAELISGLQPEYVFLENVDAIWTADSGSVVEFCPWCLDNGRGKPFLSAFERVIADLSQMGFDAEWCCVPASCAGAPHRRERFFLLAFPHADSEGLERGTGRQRADVISPEGDLAAA